MINGVAQDILTAIDARFYNDIQLSAKSVSNASVAIVNEPAFSKSGSYTVKINGTVAGFSDYYYKIAETKIAVKVDM